MGVFIVIYSCTPMRKHFNKKMKFKRFGNIAYIGVIIMEVAFVFASICYALKIPLALANCLSLIAFAISLLIF